MEDAALSTDPVPASPGPLAHFFQAAAAMEAESTRTMEDLAERLRLLAETQHTHHGEHADALTGLKELHHRHQGAIAAVTEQLGRLAENQQQRADQHTGALATTAAFAEALHQNLSSAAEKFGKEFIRLKRDADHRQDQTGKRIVASTTTIAQHIDTASGQLADLAAVHGEHHQLTGTLADEVRALPDRLAEQAQDAAEQHAAALAATGRVLDAVQAQDDHLRTTENTLIGVIATSRDQLLTPIGQLADTAQETQHQSAQNHNEARRLLDALTGAATRHSDLLETIQQNTQASAEVLPVALSTLGQSVSEHAEQSHRTVLDAEERLSAALSLSADRTGQALADLTRDTGELADRLGALTGQSPTAEAVQKLHDDVGALAEKVAATTQSCTDSVQSAVAEMAQMRRTWAEETSQVLRTLENMGRVFLEKANSSEYARDQGVIELGRRVARLELERAPDALTV